MIYSDGNEASKGTTAISKKYYFLLLIFMMVQSALHFYRFSPVHDTLMSYQVFNLVYGEFFHNGKMISWLPFSAYGFNADWYLLSFVTIFKYFLMSIGLLFRITDALLLFKIGMLLEELIFFLGVYLLSRDLFKRGEVVLFVCICALGSIFFTVQSSLNFYSYYLLPLSIYFLRLFFYKRKLWYLPLSALIVFLSIPGQATYFLVIFFIEILILFIALMAYHFRDWRDFLHVTRKEAALAGFFLACSVALLCSIMYFSFASLDYLKTLSTGRDIVTRQTPLDVFLTYGGQIGFKKFIDLIYPAVLSSNGALDVTIYIGLLSLPFAIYALIKVRDPLFKGITIVVIVLCLFSLGGYFSTIMYYAVPGMKYYRHIGLSVGSFKLFLPLMAGFGLDHFLCHSRWIRDNSFIPRVMVAVFLLAGALSCYIPSQGSGYLNKAAMIYLAVAILASIFVTFKKNFALVLLIALCVETLGYQSLVHAKFRDLMPIEPPASFGNITKIEFARSRTMFVVNERGQELIPYIFLTEINFALYNYLYSFVQWDSCNNVIRADFANKQVASMIEARGGVVRELNILLPAHDKVLLSAIGCGTSKLRLASNVAFADTEQAGVKMLQANRNDESLVILNGVPEQIRNHWVNSGMSSGGVKVTGFTYNSLEAEAYVPEPFGTWLYYADAYHPSWRALVNSEPAQVYQANTGFKAIFLPSGKNSVRFFFESSPAIRWSFYYVIMSGFIFTVACLICVFKLVIQAITPGYRTKAADNG